MESPPKSIHVQLVRLRFDAAIIEVRATDDSDAERKAIEQAQQLSTPIGSCNPSIMPPIDLTRRR